MQIWTLVVLQSVRCGYPSACVLCCSLFILWALSPIASQSQEFELFDGDRVVFVGDGFIEHAQRYGYIEAALTTRWPDRRVSFRNVGWSGDTVEGEARDHYTNPPTAYEHLLEQIAESDPTVLIMGYGGYLAFADEANLDAFKSGYHKLLDDVVLADKRCILLSPIPHEQRSSPNPNVHAVNKNLEKVTATISEIAEARGCVFFDVFSSLVGLDGLTKEPLTKNGIHLTPFGYSLVAEFFERAPFLNPSKHLVIDVEKKAAEGGEWVAAEDNGRVMTITVSPAYLSPAGTRSLAIHGLRRGTYQVSTPSGIVGAMKHDEWEEGSVIMISEEREQAEHLRSAIVEKNALYFRKYRPQNETYLVGFRKYEQGQNAVELKLLNPLIGEKENEIGRLKTPNPITLTIERL